MDYDAIMAEHHVEADMLSEKVHLQKHGIGVYIEALSSGSREIERAVNAFRENMHSRLSDDPLMNKKYLFVVSAAFAAAAAIELGMQQPDSFLLSAIYIQECDKLNSEDKIGELYKEMLTSYYFELKRTQNRAERVGAVRRVKDYIGYNLHRPIKLEDVAINVGLSPAYISTLFKKEAGVSMTEYMHEARIKEAKSLLIYTDNSCTWIANSLCYSSQSYFSYVFRKSVSMSPIEYRKVNTKKV